MTDQKRIGSLCKIISAFLLLFGITSCWPWTHPNKKAELVFDLATKSIILNDTLSYFNLILYQMTNTEEVIMLDVSMNWHPIQGILAIEELIFNDSNTTHYIRDTMVFSRHTNKDYRFNINYSKLNDPRIYMIDTVLNFEKCDSLVSLTYRTWH